MKPIIILVLMLVSYIECHNYKYEDDTAPQPGTMSGATDTSPYMNHAGAKKRELRRGGGRSRSSYSSNYSKTKTVKKKVYSSKNTYFNAASGRTYHALYVYYRPLMYYNAIGYYSTLYLMIYFNGYGYNFYYNKYGYYENSPNDVETNTGTIIGGLVFSFCIFPIMYCLVCKYCGDDDGEDSVEERVEKTTVTTTTTHVNNMNNDTRGYGGNSSSYDSSDSDRNGRKNNSGGQYVMGSTKSNQY